MVCIIKMSKEEAEEAEYRMKVHLLLTRRRPLDLDGAALAICEWPEIFPDYKLDWALNYFEEKSYET